MIRDPSDGSVRHVPANVSKTPVLDTGIRQPTRSDAQERMERSREWLKNYHAKKETIHARGSNGKEHSADGSAGDDQGEAEPGLPTRANG